MQRISEAKLKRTMSLGQGLIIMTPQTYLICDISYVTYHMSHIISGSSIIFPAILCQSCWVQEREELEEAKETIKLLESHNAQIFKVAQESMTATNKHLEATNKHLKWSSEIDTMLILKLLKGKTRWESTRMGDELSVTYTRGDSMILIKNFWLEFFWKVYQRVLEGRLYIIKNKNNFFEGF